jgi:hypothetical protein
VTGPAGTALMATPLGQTGDAVADEVVRPKPVAEWHQIVESHYAARDVDGLVRPPNWADREALAARISYPTDRYAVDLDLAGCYTAAFIRSHKEPQRS